MTERVLSRLGCNDLLVDEEEGPAPAQQFDSFNFGAESESQATPRFLAHLQQCLAGSGVAFGRGGFELHDVHTNTALIVLSVLGFDKVVRGGTDGIITPYGVATTSALQKARVLVEIKGPNFNLTQALSQARIELVAAQAISPHPVLLLLTDGAEHNWCLRVSIKAITMTSREKEPLSWARAVACVARFLKQSSTDRSVDLSAFLGKRPADAAPLCDATLVSEIKRLREAVDHLTPPALVEEQLDAVDVLAQDPAERVQVRAQLRRRRKRGGQTIEGLLIRV